MATLAPATIVRTRGQLGVGAAIRSSTQAQFGAFGICFVSEVARALGVTAIPGPATDALWDGWFVHQFFTQLLSVTTDVGISPDFFTQYVIDSKAMRKFDGDATGLVIMLENTGANAFDTSLGLRFLLKAG